jgi:deoxyribonuclease-4
VRARPAGVARPRPAGRPATAGRAPTRRPLRAGGVATAAVRDSLGAHQSIAGGLPEAVRRGVAGRCGAIQLFLKNQLQWAGRLLAEDEVAEFRRELAASPLRVAFAHATYLINPATPEPAESARAVAAFADELERAERLGLPFVVIHPGSHRGAGREAGLAALVRALDEVVGRTAGFRVRVALENSAGAGHLLGARAAELGAVFARVRRPERLALCLDTCHLFAAGHDIRTPRRFARVLAEFDRAVGLDHLVAFHLNDARAALGSGLDRHEHIGAGRIGLAAFAFLVNHPRVGGLPMVLETPKPGDADARNLATLRRLRRRPAG